MNNTTYANQQLLRTKFLALPFYIPSNYPRPILADYINYFVHNSGFSHALVASCLDQKHGYIVMPLILQFLKSHLSDYFHVETCEEFIEFVMKVRMFEYPDEIAHHTYIVLENAADLATSIASQFELYDDNTRTELETLHWEEKMLGH